MKIKLDNQDFSVLVFRCSDGRQLTITDNNWQEVKDAIELSVYESRLNEISLRPNADSETPTTNEVWLP